MCIRDSSYVQEHIQNGLKLIAINKAEQNTLQDIESLANLTIAEYKLFFPVENLLMVKFPVKVEECEKMGESKENILQLSILLKVYSMLYEAGEGLVFSFKHDGRIVETYKKLTSNSHRWKINGIKPLLDSITL
eukprot:TRINITY_DN26008_c0_g1_i2.p1 TRINITY_DN26008_c0_g1~~TRINITY_DN26008_c0_g1_i2.p1  ORF type:complete len:134 (+),score=22.39 TRINITY_DN26008_c0_g1_i2:65-466(+)